MKSITNYLGLILLFLTFQACAPARVPFTQQLREKYELKPEELKSIQFYTSNDLVLRRGENKNSKETENGELKLLKDGLLEEIVIKAGTPCLIEEVVDGNRVKVSFEDGVNKYLVFGSINNRDGYYTLLATEWVGGKGKMNYGEQMYMSNSGSKDLFLTLRVKSLQKFKTDQKVVKGKKI